MIETDTRSNLSLLRLSKATRTRSPEATRSPEQLQSEPAAPQLLPHWPPGRETVACEWPTACPPWPLGTGSRCRNMYWNMVRSAPYQRYSKPACWPASGKASGHPNARIFRGYPDSHGRTECESPNTRDFNVSYGKSSEHCPPCPLTWSRIFSGKAA
jgi:hypothetical protein